ncbi:VPLPA-CTERM sorting domain-containing protein [Tropicibacter sp. S64]|uniref:VPLPA-CTERM sorting domain-containing protein n=1 Tax=Tropicibacter sp. S64 TaxID=3415122 RepID=UPI003C7D089A
MKMLLSVAAPALLASTVTASAASFVLDFTDPTNSQVTNSFGDNGYADLSYRALAPGPFGNVASNGDLYGWTLGYGDLNGAIWAFNDGSLGEIRIEAQNPLETVTIDSFEMGGWNFDENASWAFFDLAWNLLGSGSGIAPNSGSHLSVTAGVSSVGGIIFQWGDDAWDVGVQNFAYSVSGSPVSSVPLPASGLFLFGGLGALALRRRKAA